MGIDGYLTSKVQLIWPDATVRWVSTNRKNAKGQEIQRWYVERPGHLQHLDLGTHFNAARLSVNALLKKHREEMGTAV